MNQVSSLKFGRYRSGLGPSFYRGYFTISGTPIDSFLVTEGWSKGNAFINGVNLGRYWKIGPQYSLYVPAAFLKSGQNEVIIFESENSSSKFVTFQNTTANV